jgi:hypothetical protein
MSAAASSIFFRFSSRSLFTLLRACMRLSYYHQRTLVPKHAFLRLQALWNISAAASCIFASFSARSLLTLALA